jgi:hypothetical protein
MAKRNFFPKTKRSSRRSGMTLIELAVGMAVLLTGVLGFGQTLVCIERSHARTRETGRAVEAARFVLERVQAEAFPEAFRRFNGDPSDDPGGVGTAPGANFRVEGLNAVPGDADGLPGEVIFPTRLGMPGILREDIDDVNLQMPRDLSGDGVIDGADHSTDYRILPLIVRVRWRGTSGNGVVELRTMLGDY